MVILCFIFYFIALRFSRNSCMWLFFLMASTCLFLHSTDLFLSKTERHWPHMDGIQKEFYFAFWSILGLLLHEIILFSVDKSSSPKDVSVILILLLPRKKKDPLDYGSYRPFSLIKSDDKIYAKVTACLLHTHMLNLIYGYHAGFIRIRRLQTV